jgi:glyoxalase family protein
MTAIPGIHHVTAISGPPQENVDFYAGRLGQRLVKKTVNFDDPGTYHLYYGDHAGSPGTILTFFPFADAGPGRAGPGMASAFAYAIPKGDLDAMIDELSEGDHHIPAGTERFGQRVITLRDPDGAPVELIETEGAVDRHGFHSVTLWERDPEPTARLLTEAFGYRAIGSERGQGGERLRLVADGAERGHIIDIWRADVPTVARPGRGTIHHIAFLAKTQEDQHHWQEALLKFGHRTTPVIDRQYFNAIYFREPGGVLFEIATDPPGFAIDEPVETMGSKLMLPARHERLRDRIEAVLPPIKLPGKVPA